jgi:hypothetical protein
MKAYRVAVIATLVVTTAVQGVVIGWEWAGSPDSRVAVADAGTPITARFYINNPLASFAQRPVIQAIGLVLNAWQDEACLIPADMTLMQVSVSTSLAGWIPAPVNNNTYLNGLQFAALYGPNTYFGQGKTYAVDVALQWASALPSAPVYITTNRAASALIDNTGADYMTNDEIWYPSGFETAGKAKWGFGNWGGGAWSRYDEVTYSTYFQNANPLILDIPEPSSVMLLVIGAVAAYRKRL